MFQEYVRKGGGKSKKRYKERAKRDGESDITREKIKREIEGW